MKEIKIKFSPVGPGIVTGETQAGYPMVNHVAVTWLVLDDGQWTLHDLVGRFRTGHWKLFIDDERIPTHKDSIVFRSSAEAIAALESWSREGIALAKDISFDHDLGGDDTSIVFINWLIERWLDKKITIHPDTVFSVHSQNPVGAANIKSKMLQLLEKVIEESA